MLALLLSPLGRWLAAAVLSLALVAGAYIKGRTDRARLDESAALRATVSSLTEQLQQTKAVADAAQLRADAREQEKATLDERVRDYEAALAKRRTECGCALSDDDIRMLRNIIGPTPRPVTKPAPDVR